MRFPWCPLLILLMFLSCGCGSQSKATVSGKVLYGDKPLTRGNVTFFPEKGGAITTSIEQDGSYRAINVPVGPVKIAVQVPKTENIVPPMDPAKVPEPMKSMVSAPKAVPIPDKYGNPDQSGLTWTVEGGGAQQHDIVIPR